MNSNAFLILGAILLLAALLGGKVRFFGDDVASILKGTPTRMLFAVLGVCLLLLYLNAWSKIDPPPTCTSPCQITTKFGAELLSAPDMMAGQSIRELPVDAQLCVIEVKKTGLGGNYFYKVEYDKTIGWVDGFRATAKPQCFDQDSIPVSKTESLSTDCEITTEFGATLRAMPIISGQSLGKIPADVKLAVIEVEKAHAGQMYFFKVQYNNITGWVSGLDASAAPGCIQL